MTRPSLRPTALVAVAIASLVLLTGCFRLDTEVSVSEDNKVSGSFAVAMNAETLAMTGMTADDLISEDSDAIPEDATDAPWMKDVTRSEYKKDGFIGQQMEFVGVPLKDFSADLLPILDLYGGNPESETKPDPKYPDVKIERVGDSFKVSGVLDYTKERAEASGADEMDTEGGFEGFEKMMADGGTILTLTFPGPVESKTGKVDGNTVTWDVKLGERSEVSATASAKPGQDAPSSALDSDKTPMIAAVFGLLLVVGMAAGAFFLFRRGRRADSVGEEEESTLIDHADGDASATSAALDWSGPGPGATPYVEPQEQSAPVAEQGSGRRRADVPVDSAPATPAVEPAKVEPGWYPTADGLTLRWHDGTDWTEHTHPAQ